jgi:sterol desaturase/sphingolipid hydroxylase (fatty acid hydroxylase superfamily)
MHHVPRRLYMLNNFRPHPVNHVIGYFFSLLPFTLAGVPTEPLLIYTVAGVAVTFFQHANADLKFGPLNYLFSINVLHRWHHSKNCLKATAITVVY